MEQRQALAGFALSVALFVLALPVPLPKAQGCRTPVELAAVAQHTTAVRCEPSRTPMNAIRGPARRLFGLPIELNCADARTFETLERIGSVRARQIVDERAREPFERVDDLLRVHGIGPRTLELLRPTLSANPRARNSGSVDSPDCPAKTVRVSRVGAGGPM